MTIPTSDARCPDCGRLAYACDCPTYDPYVDDPYQEEPVSTPSQSLNAARAIEHLLDAAVDIMQSAQSIAEQDGLPAIAKAIGDQVAAIDQALLPQVRATAATLVKP